MKESERRMLEEFLRELREFSFEDDPTFADFLLWCGITKYDIFRYETGKPNSAILVEKRRDYHSREFVDLVEFILRQFFDVSELTVVVPMAPWVEKILNKLDRGHEYYDKQLFYTTDDGRVLIEDSVATYFVNEDELLEIYSTKAKMKYYTVEGFIEKFNPRLDTRELSEIMLKKTRDERFITLFKIMFHAEG